MKKKRIMAAGLAVIMALTAAGCHQTLKEDTAQTTVKENITSKFRYEIIKVGLHCL